MANIKDVTGKSLTTLHGLSIGLSVDDDLILNNGHQVLGDKIVQVELVHADIIALNATPIVAIAAPVATKAIWVKLAQF